ncbi:MAG: hypothetical protein M3546_17670 [Actinomycetota bacterium]|nr:hypothetical protein [Actinomycetota bacterium]
MTARRTPPRQVGEVVLVHAIDRLGKGLATDRKLKIVNTSATLGMQVHVAMSRRLLNLGGGRGDHYAAFVRVAAAGVEFS